MTYILKKAAAVAAATAGAMLVAGCMPQQEVTGDSSQENGAATGPGVAYAVADFDQGPVPAAIFNGSFVVADDCLVFRADGTDYLPVFGSGAVVTVSDEAVTVGERRLSLGRRLAIGGGTIERPATLRLLGGPGPCDGPTLRIGSVIG